MMNAVVIPRDDWSNYLQSFSDQHRDWLVDVRVSESGQGDEAEARQVALQGIAFAGEPRGGGTILLRAGRWGEGTVSQTLVEPVDVRVFRRDDGADEALQVESRNGAQLVLRFLSPQLPEAVDGIPD